MQSGPSWSLHVQYCGGWGYGPKFNRIKAAALKKWPGLNVSSTKDPGSTGSLEVTVTKDGKAMLVHSKLGGDGDVRPQNIASVIQKIANVVEWSTTYTEKWRLEIWTINAQEWRNQLKFSDWFLRNKLVFIFIFWSFC